MKLFLAVLMLIPAAAAAEDASWLEPGVAQQSAPIVVARSVPKGMRLQIKFDGVFSDRRDLWFNWGMALSSRFFFSEEHGVELVQLQWQDSILTDTARRVEQETSFRLDSKPARWQLASAYVWAPVYGKYAWSGSSLIHFDLYFLAGAGMRFPLSGEIQPFAQLGVGMNHTIGWNRLSIVPEYRLRMYSEQRTGATLVLESLLSVGLAWLF